MKQKLEYIVIVRRAIRDCNCRPYTVTTLVLMKSMQKWPCVYV